MEHENDPDIDEPYVPPKATVLGSSEEQSPSQPAPEPTECETFCVVAQHCFNVGADHTFFYEFTM